MAEGTAFDGTYPRDAASILIQYFGLLCFFYVMDKKGNLCQVYGARCVAIYFSRSLRGCPDHTFHQDSSRPLSLANAEEDGSGGEDCNLQTGVGPPFYQVLRCLRPSRLRDFGSYRFSSSWKKR